MACGPARLGPDGVGALEHSSERWAAFFAAPGVANAAFRYRRATPRRRPAIAATVPSRQRQPFRTVL